MNNCMGILIKRKGSTMKTWCVHIDCQHVQINVPFCGEAAFSFPYSMYSTYPHPFENPDKMLSPWSSNRGVNNGKGMEDTKTRVPTDWSSQCSLYWYMIHKWYKWIRYQHITETMMIFRACPIQKHKQLRNVTSESWQYSRICVSNQGVMLPPVQSKQSHLLG